MAVRQPGASLVASHQPRRAGACRTPSAMLSTAFATAPLPPGRKTHKGGKYAAFNGPWAAALDRMPPLPPTTGHQRAKAGLTDVPLVPGVVKAVKRERDARVLVALLPFGAAPFLLDRADAAVSAMAPSDVAERLVGKLKHKGAGSLAKAASALGRLLEWAANPAHDVPGGVIDGCVVTDFYESLPAASRLSVVEGLRFVSDWCGVNVAARTAVVKPPKRDRTAQLAPSIDAPLADALDLDVGNDRESFSLRIVCGLEAIAATHASKFVRGHAAMWAALALHALRREQGTAVSLRAVYSHPYDGGVYKVCIASVHRDKNPDVTKQRPRPAWAIVDGIAYPGAVRNALREALTGYESVSTLLLDTDSPSGSPDKATTWVAAALSGEARADASLHYLLQLPEIGLSREQAARYHGHAAKRFLLNVAEAMASMTPTESNEVGRFSGSTSQQSDLEPKEQMLAAHDLRSAILPAIYAGKAKVVKIFNLLARIQRAMTNVVGRLGDGGYLELPLEDGWEVFHDE